uniref:Uncharacterized protein n=1 Tax=Arundo donax TaxID=35708 RepID=A0A0A9A8G2_ARUDO
MWWIAFFPLKPLRSIKTTVQINIICWNQALASMLPQIEAPPPGSSFSLPKSMHHYLD